MHTWFDFGNGSFSIFLTCSSSPHGHDLDLEWIHSMSIIECRLKVSPMILECSVETVDCHSKAQEKHQSSRFMYSKQSKTLNESGMEAYSI